MHYSMCGQVNYTKGLNIFLVETFIMTLVYTSCSFSSPLSSWALSRLPQGYAFHTLFYNAGAVTISVR